MSLGPVMLGVSGHTLTPDEREMLRHPLVGGVILFTRNYADPAQVEALVTEIHGLREPHLLVAVDHEGGRVQRFREGFTRLPPMRDLGVIYEHDSRRAKGLAETVGWLMAVELRAVGVDFSFAPVLDLDHGVSGVIGDRAFHRNPEIVADLAHAFMAGMGRAGMAATGKHFPGHGAVAPDSHIAIANDERSYNDIYLDDIVPFERMIHYGLAAIMPAHVIYPNVAPEPAGFSPFWMKEVLRRRLGFQGVIFSDDLEMEGASVAGDIVDRAHAALDAGCDMVLCCNDFAAMAKLLDGMRHHDDPVSHFRLMRMHGRHPITRAQLRGSAEWKQAVMAMEEGLLPQTMALL
ncbi:MAG: beta-N-acetylhexosaminidase [Pseudomonadota bacterium]